MSTALGVVTGVALQAAALFAVVGVAARCVRWARAPSRPVPLTPAPRSGAGVGLRLAAELVLFRSLWRATRLGWLLGWTFHLCLAVVLLDHLWLVVDPVPAWMWQLHAHTRWVAAVGLAAIAGLLARRVLDPRLRHVSAPSDHAHLLLLGSLFAAGLALRTTHPVDLGAVRQFTLALAEPRWLPLPADPVLVAHLAGAAALLVVFPMSKLMHAPALLFSPSIAARDRARGSS